MRESRLKAWLTRHLQVLFDTLGRMWKSPLSTTMTILVLAIAMALPLVLHKLAESVENVMEGWSDRAQISLFLSASDNKSVDAIEFGQQLLQKPGIEDVEYVSPEQGVADLSELPGFADAIASLPENPVPPLLIVYPAADMQSLEIEVMALELSQLVQVDEAVYDQQWIQRLTALVDLIKRGILVIAALMAIGIALVISNTVRLGITNRTTEIEIIDQVGGTHRFIRRPFLYLGGLQCLLGTICAWGISNLTILLLAKPVEQLAKLYQSSFSIGFVDFRSLSIVMLLAILLGLVAAVVTVNRHLRLLKPQ